MHSSTRQNPDAPAAKAIAAAAEIERQKLAAILNTAASIAFVEGRTDAADKAAEAFRFCARWLENGPHPPEYVPF